MKKVYEKLMSYDNLNRDILIDIILTKNTSLKLGQYLSPIHKIIFIDANDRSFIHFFGFKHSADNVSVLVSNNKVRISIL